MANNTGTLVTSPIRPQSDADKFPTAFANEILGGAKQYLNTTLRDAIPAERRVEGMLVTTVTDTGFWRLHGGTGNGNWISAVPNFPTGNYTLLTDFNNEISARISGDTSLSTSLAAVNGGLNSLASSVNAISGAVTGLAQRTTNLEITVNGFGSGSGFVSTGDLLNRDIQYGLNTFRQNYIVTAMADLDPRSLIADTTTVPRTGGAIIATQSGQTLSVPSGGFLFSPADIGRRLIFDNGFDTVITGIFNPGGVYLGPSYSGTYWNPTNIVYTDRNQNTSGQFKLQAKGLCFVSMGDSTGYTSYTDLRNKLYRAYGYGGAFISAASDSTMGDYEFTIKSTGVVELANAYDCAPAGLAWSIPSGGNVECYIQPKYRTNFPDDPMIFDIVQEERLTDWATVIVKKKTGAKIKVERRRHEDYDWTTVADNVDVSTGSEDLVSLHYSHPLDVCWHYRVSTVQDSGGGGLTVVGIYMENRTTPGFVYVRWDTGGSKITDFNTITTSSLKVLNQVLKIDCVLYQFRDYNGPGQGQVPNLPVILPQVTQKWKDAGARNNWVFVGGYNNDDNTVYWENEAMRDFALANGHIWIDLRAFVKTFKEAWDNGLMSDGTHLGGKGARPMGNIVAQQLGLLDNPWAKSAQNTKALQGDFDFLRIQNRDVRLAIEAAKYGPWENGVKNLSASGYTSWVTIPAPGITGFTVQVWVDIPTAIPSSALTLFGLYPTTSTSNAAKNITCSISTSGRFSISFRNYTNDGSTNYELDDIIKVYGGQRACVTVVVDPSQDHPTIYIGTQKANFHCQHRVSRTAAVTTQSINTPFDAAGTSLNIPITTTHFFRAMAWWNGVVSEAELLKNADRGTVSLTTSPVAYWVASQGAGRYIYDISGNNRHILLRNTSPASLNDSGDGLTTGFAWLKPTSARTTFVMTANLGMVARQGEDIIVNITAGTLGTITLPANPDPTGPSIRVFGMSAGFWRIAQPANVQIATGAGTVEGKDITTAGVTGYLQSANKYDVVELKAISNVLWVAPSFPVGATVAVNAGSADITDPLNVAAARAAAWTRGGAKTIGNYNIWGTIPAIGTSGFTLQAWKQIPLTNPFSLERLMLVSSAISLSVRADYIDLHINNVGRLAVVTRNTASDSSRTYLLNGFVAKYAGQFNSITVRFDPTKTFPEVWVGNERADSVSGGGLSWVLQDSGPTPPTMATMNISGTNVTVGTDVPTYQFALWNGVLTDAEIVKNATAAKLVGTTLPLFYLLFNEGRGRYVYDNSGNDRHFRAMMTSNGFLNDSGNGITTGLIWLTPLKVPVFSTIIVNQGNVLRQGERFEAISNTSRVPATLPDFVSKDLGPITVFGFGNLGFQINQPSGHRIIISGQGNITGVNTTVFGTGGCIRSTDYLTEFQLTPFIVDNVTPQIIWHGKTLAGSIAIAGIPIATSNPIVSGERIVGQTLTATPANWLETPTSVTRQWLRGTGDIVSATGLTYNLNSGDAGFIVAVRDTAINSFGSVSATSIETGVVGS